MIWKLLLRWSKSASEPWEWKHCHFQSLVSGTIKKPSSIKWNIKKLKCRKTLTVHDLNPCWQPIYCSKPDQTLLCASLRWTCWLESWCLTSSCLETASQTSLKSSVRGKLTSYTLCKSNTHGKTLTRTPTIVTRCLLIHPCSSGWKVATNLPRSVKFTFCQIQTQGDKMSMANKVEFRLGSLNTRLLAHLCLQ